MIITAVIAIAIITKKTIAVTKTVLRSKRATIVFTTIRTVLSVVTLFITLVT